MGKRDDGNPQWQELHTTLVDGLDRWLAGQPYDIELQRWLDSGNSGAQIAVVSTTGPGTTGKVALKFGAKANESARWKEAAKPANVPTAFRKHIVEVVDSTELTHDASWLIVMNIAGGDIELFQSASTRASAAGTDFANACRVIVTSILGEWNPVSSDENSTQKDSVSTYFSQIFDISRLQEGKPLHDWLERSRINKTAMLINRKLPSEGPFPNPLAFVDHVTRFSPALRATGYRYGRAHGDLHMGNIVLSKDDRSAKNFKLIDLGQYDAKAPLARDPMYLLMSIAEHWLTSTKLGSNVSNDLISVIVDRTSHLPETKPHLEVSKEIYDASYNWTAKTGAGDEWPNQILLALAGCALRYAGHRRPDTANVDEMRGWFFDVAAVAAQRFLQRVGIWDEYQHAAPPMLPQQAPIDRAPAEESGAASEEWAQIFTFPSTHAQLAEALGSVRFDSADWRDLTLAAETLHTKIERWRHAHPAVDQYLGGLLSELDRILCDEFSADSSRYDLNRARAAVNKRIRWLLDLLRK